MDASVVVPSVMQDIYKNPLLTFKKEAYCNRSFDLLFPRFYVNI